MSLSLQFLTIFPAKFMLKNFSSQFVKLFVYYFKIKVIFGPPLISRNGFKIRL